VKASLREGTRSEKGLEEVTPLPRSQVNRKHKKTGQICGREKSSVSDLELSSLAGFFAFTRSNLCTRHIQKKLTPCEHHDWPDKRAIRRIGILAGKTRSGKLGLFPGKRPKTSSACQTDVVNDLKRYHSHLLFAPYALLSPRSGSRKLNRIPSAAHAPIVRS
jgi:hypothetical protein